MSCWIKYLPTAINRKTIRSSYITEAADDALGGDNQGDEEGDVPEVGTQLNDSGQDGLRLARGPGRQRQVTYN